MLNKDMYFMKEAYKQAELAFEDGEIPIGAVIVCQDRIIAKAYNQVERLNDATAHAEMIAITSASNFLQSKYLDECTLYVTLEPCKMCSGAISNAHIKNVKFGAFDNSKDPLSDHFVKFGGFMEEECQALIDEFFNNLRA
ncbi:MAG: nucleoside deaminase [Bacteroidetes bacterium]|nr:nucleoside deaminase [Bacteroidota bacterium]